MNFEVILYFMKYLRLHKVTIHYKVLMRLDFKQLWDVEGITLSNTQNLHILK